MTAHAHQLADEDDAPPPVGVPTWKFLWALMRFQGWRYFFNVLAMILLMMCFQLPGLATK